MTSENRKGDNSEEWRKETKEKKKKEQREEKRLVEGWLIKTDATEGVNFMKLLRIFIEMYCKRRSSPQSIEITGLPDSEV